jgi:AAHS family 4-hydroxybenzoate transporter-like MFS transporter
MIDIANITKIIDENPLGGFQKRIALLCGAVVFAEGVNTQAVGYIAPALAQAWHLGPSDLGLFFSLGLFGLLLGALFVAPLADRFGRRPLLLGCVPFLALCSLLTAASPSVPVLDGLRFLTGLGIGGALPNAIALTSEYSPHRRRSLMIATMFTGFIFGSLAVGLVATRLVPLFGWQSIFVLGGLLPLLLTPVLFFGLPESVRFMVLRGAAHEKVIAVLRRLYPALEFGPSTRLVIEEKTATGTSVVALFRDGRAKTTVLLWIMFFMSLLDLFLLTNWLPTEMHALGVPVGTAIIVGTLFQLGGVFGTGFGWLADRIGASAALTSAYLLGAACVAGIGFAGANVPVVMLAVFGTGFGILGGQTVANAVSAIAYPTEIRSTGVGWATGVGRAGSILGPGLAGVLLSMHVPTQHIFFLAVIPALVAAAAAAALGPLKPKLIETQAEAQA